MNTPTDTAVNTMQGTEAFPLEDHSLPAEEVLNEQRAKFAETPNMAPVFVP